MAHKGVLFFSMEKPMQRPQ